MPKQKQILRFKKHSIKEKKHDPIEDLVAIYEETDESDKVSTPNSEVTAQEEASLSFKNIIKKNRSRRKFKTLVLVFIALFLLAGAALAGFLFFDKAKQFSDSQITLTITGPNKIKIGEKFDYIVKYQNLSDTKLLNSRINIQYPHGFILETTDPAQTENHIWNVGALSFAKTGEIKLTGKIVDTLTTEQKIETDLTFRPENFNSDFSKTNSLATQLETPDIDLTTAFPANITLGQKTTFNLKIKNTGSIGLDDAKIIFHKPDTFTIQTTTPAATQNNNEWPIARLDPFSDIAEIQVTGNFPKDMTIAKDEDRTQNFSFALLLKGQDEQYYLAKEQTFSTKIINQALNAYLIINGSTENKGIALGDKLTFSLVAKNAGQQAFKDIQLKTTINSTPFDIIDWSKISDDNYGKIEKTDRGKEITWSKTQIAGLGSFNAGQEQTINFSLPIKSLSDLQKENSNLDIDLLGKTMLDCAAEIDFPNTDIAPIKSSSIQLRLDTNPKLNTKALYYFEDGTPIGAGGMPPKVGQNTKLQLFWDIANDLHDITDITVSTTLPANINWSNDSHLSTGDIKYDPATRKITWTISRLPQSVPTASANFALDFTPTATDIGKLIQLTNNTTLSTRDAVTNSILVKTTNPLTTALEQDTTAVGQGIVIP